MKKICIDASLSGIQHTGIGRYVENLIKNLPESDNLKVIVIKSRFHPYSFLYQFDILFQLLKHRPDLVHVPHFTFPIFWPGKVVLTIHDLIKHVIKGQDTTTKNPALYWPKYFAYRLLVRLALTRSTHIITPTNYWKNILASDFKVPSEKISVTYEGVDEIFFQSETKPLLSSPYLVYTGNLYPHKNLSVLIKASEKLKINLKIICARSVFASRLPNSSYIEYLGQLTDLEIIKVYSQAFAFVFPSLLEGFGLTGLEAMAVGLPVIAADASCLPEVYQDAALYFDPYNIDDLVTKINMLKNDHNLYSRFSKKGQNLAKTYSWSKMSHETWNIYRKILHLSTTG